MTDVITGLLSFIIIYQNYLIYIFGFVSGAIGIEYKSRKENKSLLKRMVKDKIRDLQPITKKLKEYIAYYILINSIHPINKREIVITESKLFNEFHTYELKFIAILESGIEIEFRSIDNNLFNELNNLYTQWRMKKSDYYMHHYEHCKDNILVCDNLLVDFLKN
jgi:hypothetical protein